jgi:GT2 family glycosyltransferase
MGPGSPILVVSEFQPEGCEWIPYHLRRSAAENRELLLSKLAGREIAGGALILDLTVPHEALRELGISMLGPQALVFDETGLTNPLRHKLRSKKQSLKARLATAQRLLNPDELNLSLLYRRAVRRGQELTVRPPAKHYPEAAPKPDGISIVIPSRNGRELLERCLAALTGATEIIVVDNGSSDGTVDWLAETYTDVLTEHSPEALPFAVSMNRGFRRARFAYVCALNNDMVVEPGFLSALRAAFDAVPELFCASAQIFMPEGQRREETGKTALNLAPAVTDLPVRCDIPLQGEDLSYVPYGSGGCSLYSARKLEALGGFDESYTPAYFEDLDLGLRAWSHGWPSVYCAQARVLHQHRSTTARYFTPAELDLILESNYLRFVVRAFSHMWSHAVLRLKALGKKDALAFAASIDDAPRFELDTRLLPLFSGAVAVYPGRARSGKPVILIASPYLPFPLSHGAAVRIFNLIRETAPDFDIVLVAFLEEARPVPAELLELCVEAVTVLRPGTHALPSRGRPDTVEEFDTPAFRAALRQTMSKWKPSIAQLEFTQMAVYAPDCAPAKTILVEHDITYDLYAQMLARATGQGDDWETRRQHDLWMSFEQEAWGSVDAVVTMSGKDRAVVGSKAVTIGNGVDLERFQPSNDPPEPRRLLFIGSFAHKPNVLALEFFLRDVFPLLSGVTLHVIAGQNHQRFWDLKQEGVELDGFVTDVRPAYRKAAVVIAPLVASAGTNIKIVEAMAMGKAIVSTDAGIHGLELARGADVLVTNTAQEMAVAITRLIDAPPERMALERHARATAERIYGWKAMASAQSELYNFLAKIE